jgi:integrase/recombinase XerD
MQLYDRKGQRKYLTPAQRQGFLGAARKAAPDVRTFCETLAHTGSRLSEALALTASRVDVGAGVLVLESLKKRRRGIYRVVPVPPAFLRTLQEVHDLPALGDLRLWDWSRTTGWRRVKEVMEAADIRGLCASPKGVRHAFGIKAVTSEVPLNMTQKWLGHSRISTTSIYTDAIGPEEQRIAERMWEPPCR